MSWCWFNVDAQGRADIADEQARSWARVQEIEVESNSRCAESGEEPTSIIVASMGFMRSRNSLAPPAMCEEKPTDGQLPFEKSV
jgi:hypothetical protein